MTYLPERYSNRRVEFKFALMTDFCNGMEKGDSLAEDMLSRDVVQLNYFENHLHSLFYRSRPIFRTTHISCCHDAILVCLIQVPR